VTVGTRSVLFGGVHNILVHPLFVGIAWWKLFGTPVLIKTTSDEIAATAQRHGLHVMTSNTEHSAPRHSEPGTVLLVNSWHNRADAGTDSERIEHTIPNAVTAQNLDVCPATAVISLKKRR